MQRLVTLTWSPRAPHGIHAVRAAHRRPAMAEVGIDVHTHHRHMCSRNFSPCVAARQRQKTESVLIVRINGFMPTFGDV